MGISRFTNLSVLTKTSGNSTSLPALDEMKASASFVSLLRLVLANEAARDDSLRAVMEERLLEVVEVTYPPGDVILLLVVGGGDTPSAAILL